MKPTLGEGVPGPCALATRQRLAIAAPNGLGAFRTLLAEAALVAAVAVDERRAGEDMLPVDGLAVATKENFAVRGVPTTAGMALPADPAKADSPAVTLLRRAGAVLLGTTAMDEAAFGAMGDNPHWGRVQHPIDPERAPGGSSAGSAVAVAAKLVDAALGTDTLGSVRIPASYCGVVGFKPTRGRVSLRDVLPLAPTLDHAGILARDVGTVAAVFAVLDRYDPVWPGSLPTPSDIDRDRDRRDTVVVVPRAIEAVALEPEVAAAFAAALGRLETGGLPVVRADLGPGWLPEPVRRAGLLLVEAEAAAVHATALGDEGSPLSPGLRRALLFGRDCGTGRLVKALSRLQAASIAFEAALARHGAPSGAGAAVIVTPTTPELAPRWRQSPPEAQAIFTTPANVAGLPAITLPIGHGPLKAGLQLVGARHEDRQLLELAALVGPMVTGP